MPPKRPRRAGDSDDDERPTRKKRVRQANNSMMIWILAGGGAVLLLTCGACGLIGFLVFKNVPDGRGPKNRPPIAQPNRPGNDGGDNLPPQKPANHVADASVSVPIDIPSEVKDIVFADPVTRAAFLYWNADQNLAKQVDVWDWQNPRRLTRVTLPDQGDQIQLSPNGTRLLSQNGGPPKLNIWSIPEGQSIVKDWDPYPKDAQNPFGIGNGLVWAFLVAEDRVLTLTRSGQLDLWNLKLNPRQLLFSVPAPKPPLFLTANGFARAPQNFALSPNRKLLAITNGNGFDILDTSNGNRIANTQPFAAPARIGNCWSLSFNRAGTMLAFKGILQVQNMQQDVIAVWEIPSGKKKNQFNIGQDFDATGPIAWLGPRHLLICDGNLFKGNVFSIAQGSYQRTCKTSSKMGDRFARFPPDDRIWYVTRTGFNTPGVLAAVDLPEKDLQRDPGPNALTTGQLPLWGCYPKEILRVQPNEQ